MNDSTVYLSTAYLAPVAYYQALARAMDAMIESHCNYLKQTYRNRCVIASANGPLTLSIPIRHPQSSQCPTKDVRISEHGNWRKLHWNAIVSAYQSSPFFEYYEADFAPFYAKRFDFLFDYNESLRELLCQLLDIHSSIRYTASYKIDFSSHELDLRAEIHPKKPDAFFHFKPYYQVFERKFGFIPNLSIIDLLFNMGPEAVLFL
ncbi:MAG: WbqC family protein [Dysgonamonadaceae bacterium]|jgi:hypothetical protein|nr:WbqC family protein [Dysgonamonadaceae bacterium]